MNYSKYLTHPIFKHVSESAEHLNYPVFVVGGWVRDLLLKRNKADDDIDFVCVGNGIDLAKEVIKRFKQNTLLKVYKNFGTALITNNKYNFEFIGARKESYRKKSRNPIVENGTLVDDQNRRDFTINSMYIQLNKEHYGKLIDPFNGQVDLKRKIIRTPLDPNKTFGEDPLRMLRAIRFASELNFNIELESYESIKLNNKRLSIISQERITDELNKIIICDKPSRGFKMLFETKLLHEFFPEIANLHGVEIIKEHKHKDNFLHTLKVLDNISLKTNNLWLRWAAILHDIAKPITKKFDENQGWTFHAHEFIGSKMVPKIFKRLKLPLNDKMKYVQKLVLLHLRPIVLAQDIVTDSAIRRLLFDAKEDVEDLMLLCEADITSKNQNKVMKYLNNFKIVREKLKIIEEKDSIRNFQPPVNGKEIMQMFNLKAGRNVGILKNTIKEAILNGDIKNNKKEAIKYLIKKAQEINLNAV